MWAVLVFRHEDRIVGKAREVPYNLVQKAETKLRTSQSQQRLWQLVNAARATTANRAVQWRFLPHGLHAMAPIIKGTHGVQRSQREASALGGRLSPRNSSKAPVCGSPRTRGRRRAGPSNTHGLNLRGGCNIYTSPYPKFGKEKAASRQICHAKSQEDLPLGGFSRVRESYHRLWRIGGGLGASSSK